MAAEADSHDGRGRPRRGRPRSPEADRAILDATLELLDESGVARLTMERVARRARVAKTTVYRRWRDKPSLIAAALDRARPPMEPPDTGSLEGDLAAIVSALEDDPDEGRFLEVAALVVTALADDELRTTCWASYVEPRRAAVSQLLERAQQRGELSPRIDVDLLAEVIAGSLLYQLMRPTDEPLHRRMERVHRLVAQELTGPSAVPSPR